MIAYPSDIIPLLLNIVNTKTPSGVLFLYLNKNTIAPIFQGAILTRGFDMMNDWIDEKIIDPMNKWAEKHPWFPLIFSIVALVISILLPIVRLSLG